MSDAKPARPDSIGTGTDAGTDIDETGDGQTAVVTRPPRPTGKRSRRGSVEADAGDVDTGLDTEAGGGRNGSGTAKKTAKKDGDRPEGRRNPFAYVWTYLSQVVAELRKVIWPNRKQMISYTTVVLIFLAFMVALIGLVDLGLVKLVSMLLG